MKGISRSDFLSLPPVNKLKGIIAHMIEDELPFQHSYSISHKGWAKQNVSQEWSCTSLKDARDHYWWFGNISENQAALKALSDKLKLAITADNEHAGFVAVVKVLDWGQVYKGCLGFATAAYENGKLLKIIKDSVVILQGNSTDCLERFNGTDLRMDSGMTKVYSLASEGSIIFDSRVASALTLIAYRFLTESDIHELYSHDVLSVGKAPSGDKRNKIGGKKLLARNVGSGLKQARYNLLANWLLNAAIDEIDNQPAAIDSWKVENKQALLRNVESALFMIGSDISRG